MNLLTLQNGGSRNLVWLTISNRLALVVVDADQDSRIICTVRTGKAYGLVASLGS
jgi:hypothetical protein